MMDKPGWQRIAKRRVRRTKRPSVCRGCQLTISAGSSLIRMVGKRDGRFEAYDLCESCNGMMELYCLERDFRPGQLGRMRNMSQRELRLSRVDWD